MSETCDDIRVDVIEIYRNVPIVEQSYVKPTLLTPEVHTQHCKVLLELPYERFALIIRFTNLSYSSEYGAEEQVKFYNSETFQELKARLVTVVRYSPGSLTSVISTMAAQMQVHGASNFLPDQEFAIRACRRMIERMEEVEVDPA